MGKNYVLRTLSDRYGGRYSFSVSHTTRGPRPGEENGTDYNFVSHAEFQELAQVGEKGLHRCLGLQKRPSF